MLGVINILLHYKEEAGISAPLEQIGNFLFVMDGVGVAFQISIFRASEYVGQIVE